MGLKIIPDKNGIYNGAVIKDISFNKKDVEDFEGKSGQKLDIAGKFMDFRWGLKFPTEMAEIMSRNGGALMIKLETGALYSLDDIIKGNADNLLREFALGAKAFGKPVFVSIDHEMNGNDYPWCGDPQKYIKAYKYIHDKIESIGAGNITWTWNPNVGYSFASYYPGDNYVDWVALDGYNSTDWSNWSSFKDKFSFWLDEIGKYGKPIMIGEYGCDANDAGENKIEKPKWIRDAVDAIVNDRRIKAFIYFNISKMEGNQQKDWALKGESLEAYNAALKKYDELFKSGIFIGDKIEGKTNKQIKTNAEPIRSNKNATYFTDTCGKVYCWNGGNAIYSSGVWRFAASNAGYPGFHIDNPGGNKKIQLSKKGSLKLSVKGTYKSDVGNSNFQVQVFEGENKTTFYIDDLDDKNFKEYTFDLGEQKNITKILFIMISGKGTCDIQIKDFRIE